MNYARFCIEFFHLFLLGASYGQFLAFEELMNTYLLIFFNIVKSSHLLLSLSQILRNVGIFGSMSAGIFGGFC